jgi:hypothetical protein
VGKEKGISAGCAPIPFSTAACDSTWSGRIALFYKGWLCS